MIKCVHQFRLITFNVKDYYVLKIQSLLIGWEETSQSLLLTSLSGYMLAPVRKEPA